MEPLTCSLSELIVDPDASYILDPESPLAHKYTQSTPSNLPDIKPSLLVLSSQSFSLEPHHFSPPRGRKPLMINFTTSSCTDDPLFPATHLLLSFRIGSMEVFTEPLQSGDIHQEASGSGTYSILYPSQMVPQLRVPAAMGTTTEVILHAWRNDKFLDQWIVGRMQGLNSSADGTVNSTRMTRSRKQVAV